MRFKVMTERNKELVETYGIEAEVLKKLEDGDVVFITGDNFYDRLIEEAIFLTPRSDVILVAPEEAEEDVKRKYGLPEPILRNKDALENYVELLSSVRDEVAKIADVPALMGELLNKSLTEELRKLEDAVVVGYKRAVDSQCIEIKDAQVVRKGEEKEVLFLVLLEKEGADYLVVLKVSGLENNVSDSGVIEEAKECLEKFFEGRPNDCEYAVKDVTEGICDEYVYFVEENESELKALVCKDEEEKEKLKETLVRVIRVGYRSGEEKEKLKETVEELDSGLKGLRGLGANRRYFLLPLIETNEKYVRMAEKWLKLSELLEREKYEEEDLAKIAVFAAKCAAYKENREIDSLKPEEKIELANTIGGGVYELIYSETQRMLVKIKKLYEEEEIGEDVYKRLISSAFKLMLNRISNQLRKDVKKFFFQRERVIDNGTDEDEVNWLNNLEDPHSPNPEKEVINRDLVKKLIVCMLEKAMNFGGGVRARAVPFVLMKVVLIMRECWEHGVKGDCAEAYHNWSVVRGGGLPAFLTEECFQSIVNKVFEMVNSGDCNCENLVDELLGFLQELAGERGINLWQEGARIGRLRNFWTEIKDIEEDCRDRLGGG